MQAEQGGAPQQEPAPFDDTAAALRFALNAHQVSVPSSYMNRQLADFTPTPRRKKPTKAERAVLHAIGVASLDHLREMLKGRRRTPRAAPPRPTRGLDAAHLAGYILREFGKLPDVDQLILTGLLTNPVLPCSCGRPCCSGWEPVARWVQAVDRTCDLLRERALVIANPDYPAQAPRKVGLSTQPDLRRAIVKDWYRREDRTLADLASRYSLKDETVARHRGWIHEWLEAQEHKAWESVNWWFDQVGITGPWL